MNCPICNKKLIDITGELDKFVCAIDLDHSFYFQSIDSFEVYLQDYFVLLKGQSKCKWRLSLKDGWKDIDPFELSDVKTIVDKILKLKAFI